LTLNDPLARSPDDPLNTNGWHDKSASRFFVFPSAALAGFARLDSRGRLFLREIEELRCQALQDFLAQFLRLAERFLVFDEDAVQF